MAHVLFLTQLLPFPLDSGAKIRAYYVLRRLAQRHEVTLVSFVRPEDRPDHVAHLAAFCASVHTAPMRRSRARDARAALVSAFTGRPVVIARDEIGAMRAVLTNLVHRERFDVIHADQTSMAQYALSASASSARSRNGDRPRLVLDAHNALYRIPERLALRTANPLLRSLYRREAAALARYERAVYRSFDHVVFVAEEDRKALEVRVGSAAAAPSLGASSLIPICVDTQAVRPVSPTSNARGITHLGTMFWPPNVEGMVWFARDVFPQVRAAVPAAHLEILGRRPPQEVQDLASQIAGVHVAGYVQDPTPYLADTAAYIVPLHAAGGMRVKILDAWAWGLPVVSTSIGAEGIDVSAGDDILIADSAGAFAAAVVRVLQEPSLAERLRRLGRQKVEQRYDWQRVYPRWDAVYDSLLPPQCLPHA